MRKSDIESFFQLYESILTKYNFKPKFIFNTDETMVNFTNNGEKCVVDSNSSPKYVAKRGLREHVTVQLFASAEGQMLTPLVILPLKTMPLFNETIRKSLNFTGQPSGWIDNDILCEIIHNWFVAEVNKLRRTDGCPEEPVLLILDNHSTRDALNGEMLWENHKIMVLCIPSHSSHILQPLDLGVNSCFKFQLYRHFAIKKDEEAGPKRERLMTAIVNALEHISVGLIKGSWAKSGLWPLNPQVISRESFEIESSSTEIKPKRKRGQDMSKGRILYASDFNDNLM